MLRYFFPSLFTTVTPPGSTSVRLDFSVDSGESALRLLLRRCKLAPNSVVAIPAFVCEAVARAVRAEGLKPLLLDLKGEGSYWTDYAPSRLEAGSVGAVVLVHLYGQVHPDTAAIADWCLSHNVPLIHDAAQGYGIAPHLLYIGATTTAGKSSNVPIIPPPHIGALYSFGPGKATTAAFGAIVDGIDEAFYATHVHPYSYHLLRRWCTDLKAHLFVHARLYARGRATHDTFQDRVVGKLLSLFGTGELWGMTPYQRRAANYSIALQPQAAAGRQQRLALVKGALQGAVRLADSRPGLGFKAVLYCSGDVEAFCDYLLAHDVPYGELFEASEVRQAQFAGLPNFAADAHRFIELSTEASIPLTEIERVAEILRGYGGSATHSGVKAVTKRRGHLRY